MRPAHAPNAAPRGPLSHDQRPVRVMLVDDSMVARAVLTRIITADPAFEIAAVAGTAEDAIVALGQVAVDIIMLDVEMPGAGGLKMLPKVLEAARGARVMIVSSLAEEGAEVTVAALALGATDTLPKPGTGRFNGRFSEVLLGKLRALGRARPSRPAPAGPALPAASGVPTPAAPPQTRAGSDADIEIIAIGASTGGIHALGTLLAALPDSVSVPILVTQHLPAPFMPVFARQLGISARREAVVATDGMVLAPGRIHIAPGEYHLTVERRGPLLVCRLVEGRVSSGCLPSVDPMFASLARSVGAGALGIVLTGMGKDGLEGARDLVAAGASVVAQDEASSAVWGMPRAIAEAGLASAILPPEKIARRIANRMADSACR